MIPTTSDEDPSERRPTNVLARIGSVLLLLAFAGCSEGRSTPQEPAPGQITTPSPVAAPADSVTIEILEPHSDYANRIELGSSSVELSLTNEDVGETREIKTEQGEEIVFEIQPLLDGSPIAGPWKSGSGSRNPDGEVHALVTVSDGSPCLLVAFEDEDAKDWADTPGEPDYSDTVFWLYPTTSPAFDTSQCPDGPVTYDLTD